MKLADLEPSRVPRLLAIGRRVVVASACAAVGVFVGMSIEHGKMIRADEDSAQAAKDVAYADSLTAGCLSLSTARRLLGQTERTAGLVRSTQDVTAAFLGDGPVYVVTDSNLEKMR